MFQIKFNVRHKREIWFEGHRQETGGEGGKAEAIDKTKENTVVINIHNRQIPI